MLGRVPRSTLPISLALVLALAPAGCGGGGDPRAPAASPEPTTTDAGGPGGGGDLAVRPIAATATERAVHTATALPGGRVLVAGGCVTDGCSTATASTEAVYEPAAGVRAGPEMAAPRVGNMATRLHGDRVLLAGGYAGEGMGALDTAEVCDPARCTAAGALADPRGAHAATRLRGDVLITGGFDEGRALRRVERFDARAGRFRPAAPMLRAHEAHTATLLRDGRVLVAGGADSAGAALAAAELYDPRSGRWSATSALRDARTKHAAVRLPDGRVMVVGGAADRETRTRLATTELYDPRTGRFTPGPRLRSGRYKLPGAFVALADGRVLVAGDAPEVELLDPARGRVTLASGDLGAARAFATATRIGDEAPGIDGYGPRDRDPGRRPSSSASARRRAAPRSRAALIGAGRACEPQSVSSARRRRAATPIRRRPCRRPAGSAAPPPGRAPCRRAMRPPSRPRAPIAAAPSTARRRPRAAPPRGPS